MAASALSGGRDHLAHFLLAGAAARPGGACLEEGEVRLTYAQLAQMVAAAQGALLEALRRAGRPHPAPGPRPPAHGRRPDEHVVLVALERGAVCFAAVHAALLEGCAYSAFDLANPRELLSVQLEVVRPPVVVSCPAALGRLGLEGAGWLPAGTGLLDLDAALCGLRRLAPEAPAPALPGLPAATPDRLAYVIFTSGSTGRPKAVMIEHRSACNFVRVFTERLSLRPEDRLSQGISMTFDMHVMEVFPAFHAGCTLVVMPDAVKRSGPDVLPWLRAARVSVTTMTPSAIRMTMGPGTDVSRASLPDLRMLSAGGEPLGEDILAAWAPGRTLFNAYGPTEVTVLATMAELSPGDGIHIGRSLPTYENRVLDPDSLQPVPLGGKGVLFTAGPGVARGYLDDEAKTRERFVDVPGLGRAYNTGDVVTQDPAGNIHWLGRADFQVKVRGYRIELEHLEAAIRRVRGLSHCEARVLAGERLALLASGEGVTEAALRTAAAALGMAYELSVVKLVDSAAWTFTTSGKLLRNAVPLEDTGAEGATAQALAPNMNTAGGVAAAALAVAKGLGVALARTSDDFFAAGGTSVTAAALVSQLRHLARTQGPRWLEQVSVRHVYECRTLDGVLEEAWALGLDGESLASTSPTTGSSDTEDTESGCSTAAGTERFCLVACLQAAWIGAEIGFAAMLIVWVVMAVGRHTVAVALGQTPPLGWHFYVAFAAIALLAMPVLILCQTLLVLGVKALLCFRAQEGRIRLWSLPYFKWWLVHHLQDMIPTFLLSGTPLAAWWVWAMGAKVGRGVVFWQVPRSADLELLNIGDGASVGLETYLSTNHAEDGELTLAPIEIGAGAWLGCRAALAPGAHVPAGAQVGDLEVVTAASDLGEGTAGGPLEERGFGCGACLGSLAVVGLVGPLYTYVAPFMVVRHTVGTRLELALGKWPPMVVLLVSVPCLSFLWQVAAVAMVVLLKWGLVGRLCEGSFSVNSAKYVRVCLVHQLLQFLGMMVPATQMTVFYPMVLRLLGARVGRGVEIGLLTCGLVPDLAELGDRCTLTDKCCVGAVRVRDGKCELRRTAVPRRAFIGNGAVVPAGSRLAPDMLVGVQTCAPEEGRAGSSWFGAPPFEVPNRPVAAARRSRASCPSACLGPLRAAWDLLRLVINFATVYGLWFLFTVGVAAVESRWAAPEVWSLVAQGATQRSIARFWVWRRMMEIQAALSDRSAAFWLGIALWGNLCVVVVLVWLALLKWVLQGRVRPGTHAQHSLCVQGTVAFESLNAFASLVTLRLAGTPLLPAFLRLLGANVGARVFLYSINVSEPDLLTIGDCACLNRACELQSHLFEDRIMKFGRVVIKDFASVGACGVVLPGAELCEGVRLGPASLCMAGEVLHGGRHVGCPARKVP